MLRPHSINVSVAALAVASAWMLGASVSLLAAELPPGFVERAIVERLAEPTSMSWAPDGHLWVSGRLGDVWELHLEDLNRIDVVHIGRIPVSTDGERGISGIAVDPDFEQNRQIWIYYTTQDPPFRNRLSRFRNVGDLLVDEQIVYESPDLESVIHNGGCLRFAADKTLYFSTGDDFQGSRTAQALADPRGKILHINRDGSPAEGNPFLGDASADPRVWAYGFRNPWRFNLQPESETLFIGDVGNELYEEIDLGVPGGNFGWRMTEGPEPPGVPGVSYPIYSYPRTSENGHAVVGGDHAPATHFPAEYEGNYFFGDAVTSEIFRMVLDDSNLPLSTEVFASNTGIGPVDIQFGPDGALYYLAHYQQALYRISYQGGSNRQPLAVASVTPNSGDAPLDVILDASDSVDPEGDALSYTWELGDGEERGGKVIRKTYPAGSYSAALTVTDARRASASVRNLRIVSGNHRPAAVIEEPALGRRYQNGEVILFSGSATDPEEGAIPCARFTWRVIFHHLGHTHPFLGPVQGSCEGSFVIDSNAVSEAFYEIQLTVEDTGMPLGPAGKLRGSRSIQIFPNEPPL